MLSRFLRIRWLLALLALPAPLSARSPLPSPGPPGPPRLQPGPVFRYRSAFQVGVQRPAASLRREIVPLAMASGTSSHRGRNAVIGGLIGGVVGVAACTVFSNIAKDPGTGFSTCTTKGYLILGLSGAALGAGIGALIK